MSRWSEANCMGYALGINRWLCIDDWRYRRPMDIANELAAHYNLKIVKRKDMVKGIPKQCKLHEDKRQKQREIFHQLRHVILVPFCKFPRKAPYVRKRYRSAFAYSGCDRQKKIL